MFILRNWIMQRVWVPYSIKNVGWVYTFSNLNFEMLKSIVGMQYAHRSKAQNQYYSFPTKKLYHHFQNCSIWATFKWWTPLWQWQWLGQCSHCTASYTTIMKIFESQTKIFWKYILDIYLGKIGLVEKYYVVSFLEMILIEKNGKKWQFSPKPA